MTKKSGLIVKGTVLGVLAVGIVFGSIARTSAYPSMSPNPDDPKSCLACHPGGPHTGGETTPTPETPTPETKPPLVSAPYPPAGPGVVWSLFLYPYTGWDAAWEDVSSTQKAPLTNSWDQAWK